MLRLLPYVGPKSYHLPDPDVADHIHRGRTRDELIRKIQNFRMQNGLEEIEHINTVLEAYWCSLKENQGNCEPNPELTRGWLQYLHGGITLFKYVFFGEKGMVDQAEADRRSTLCAACPKNVFPDKKGFVKWADSLAEHATGGRRSVLHDSLGNCEVCTCNLRAKVWQKPPLKLSAQEKSEMEKVNCWQPKVAYIVQEKV